MSIDTGWVIFFIAIRNAVASPAPPLERLQILVSEISHLNRPDFPDDLTWQRFTRLMEETKSLPFRTEGKTTQQMNEDSGRWLHEAYDLFSEMTEEYGKERT